MNYIKNKNKVFNSLVCGVYAPRQKASNFVSKNIFGFKRTLISLVVLSLFKE